MGVHSPSSCPSAAATSAKTPGLASRCCTTVRMRTPRSMVAPMSDPDFDVIRSAWAASGNKDLNAFRAHLHAEVLAIPFGAAIEGRSYRGPDQVVGWLRDEIWESWETFDTVPEEFRRVGDRILVRGHWRARGKESEIELHVAAMWVVEVRDGKVAYWQTYTDHDQALAAVGLESWPCEDVGDR